MTVTKREAKLIDLLLDVLNQAQGDSEGNIDTYCMTAYEKSCLYLEELGYLKNITNGNYKWGGRIARFFSFTNKEHEF